MPRPKAINPSSLCSCSLWHFPVPPKLRQSSSGRFPPPPLPRKKKKRMSPVPRLLICSLAFLALAPQGLVKVEAFTGTYGVNYGRIADNLPPPESVVTLLKAARIKNVRIYDADHSVLNAFKGSGLELIVAIPNGYLRDISVYEDHAMSWVKENVEAFLPDTHIKGIAVGNEVLGADQELEQVLFGAIKNVYNALKILQLEEKIEISTPHSTAVFADSFPPSSGTFKEDVLVYLKPILEFFSQTNSPFYINAYPFIAYKNDPEHIDIKYALFQSNPGVHDDKTGLHYDNMFDAIIDAAYAALEAAGYPDMEVRVSETGWASASNENEAGATVKNARTYNFNLRKRLLKKKGTPLRPKMVVKAYVFALFNENLKTGASSENHFGLFNADGSIAYNIGFHGLRSSSASSHRVSLKDLGRQSWSAPFSILLTVSVAFILAFTI
ncbi:glucan endo-1,3-beta-glucosidase 14-like [Curcuma longa]|uniref:glucan endo-1,3-beta-glucosidase 14-like n=1 Tax=Curcuma longa TaxID=136217 RepID=UPI003D9DBF2E